MRKFCIAVLLIVVLLGSTLMCAQATRTWVSGVGDDANPCSRTAPCKTFAGAISKTAAGGEIDALDPGGFGALTITKSITLDGGAGQVASVLVSGTNGILVAAQATDVVIIRNIRIDGLLGSGSSSGSAGLNGIRFTSGKALHIEKCEIFGFSQNGIDISLGASGQVFVTDTVVQNSASIGLKVATTLGTVAVAVDRSHFDGNAYGVWAASGSQVTVANSAASGNALIGFIAQGNGGTAELNLVNSVAANNGNTGVQAGGGSSASTVRTAGVSAFSNPSGYLVGMNGSIVSFGNNYITGAGGPSGSISQH